MKADYAFPLAALVLAAAPFVASALPGADRHGWLFATESAQAGPAAPFDGQWTVRITGETEDCLVAYSLAFEVDEGRVEIIGSYPVDAEGQVGNDGSVKLRFWTDKDDVAAVGTLAGRQGEGWWMNPAAGCRGVWVAKKQW